jgi:nitroreductase
MNVLEAIHERRSIRKFLDRPVADEILRHLLCAARRSPSSVNSQPWEFVVIRGEALKAIQQENARKFRNGDPAETELSTSEWPKESIFRKRQVGIAKQLFGAMDIQRGDTEKRQAWVERGFRYFDAPAVCVITYDKALSPKGPLMDIGGAVQTICLAAMEYGLGTCIAEQGVTYSSVVRRMARIDESKNLAISIAIGYPDWDYPANNVISEREDLDHLISWIE